MKSMDVPSSNPTPTVYMVLSYPVFCLFVFYFSEVYIWIQINMVHFAMLCCVSSQPFVKKISPKFELVCCLCSSAIAAHYISGSQALI